MMPGIITRYFGRRFLVAVIIIFSGLLLLVAMVDFLELMRRAADLKGVSTLLIAKISFYRVPHLTERVLPFAVMTAAMLCYMNFSRRLELVVARSAGVSAWQFIGPAVVVSLLLGAVATMVYNPVSAFLHEQSARLEGEVFRGMHSPHTVGSGFWIRQRTREGQSIINARTSNQQGAQLSGVTILRFDQSDRFQDRIEAKSAELLDGFWRLSEARIHAIGIPPSDHAVLDLQTSLTLTQVRESFATPETVPFWQLSEYIKLVENTGLAGAGYRVHYYQLLAQPFYLAAMVLLAASVSLRPFRFGGVHKMVLGGMIAGFLLYVLSKVTGDLSRAGLMPPVMAAALPVLIGGLTGLVTLLYQEDG